MKTLGSKSATRKINTSFRLIAGILLAVLFGAGIYYPIFGVSLFILAILNYWLLLSFRLSNIEKPIKLPPAAPAEQRFKKISMILPLKYEGQIIVETIRCIHALSYPEDAKELLIVVEENDQYTKGHLYNIALPKYTQLVYISSGDPATKGRALLYGLEKATGELITVFDAESRPENDQLQKVNAFFADGNEKKCCQAKVGIANKDQNWITRNFASEYYEWYDQYLPELSIKNLAFGLGGNSFYLYKKELIASGSWDPFNVTEDADLSVRLINNGIKLSILDSYTWENCPETPINWIKQRTRWNKGLLVTQMVHLFSTLFSGQFNLSSWLSFWIRMLAGTLLPLYNLFILLFLLLADIPPRSTWYMSIGLWSLFGLSLLIMTLVNFITFKRIKVKRDIFSLFGGVIVYMFLHILAGINAWWQYIFKPLKWNKTMH